MNTPFGDAYNAQIRESVEPNCIYENKKCGYGSVSHCFECDTYATFCASLSEDDLWEMHWKDETTPRGSIYDA